MADPPREEGDDFGIETLAEAPLMAAVEFLLVPLSLRDLDALMGGETMVTMIDADAAPTLRVNGKEVARVELGQIDGKVAIRLASKHPGGRR